MKEDFEHDESKADRPRPQGKVFFNDGCYEATWESDGRFGSISVWRSNAWRQSHNEAWYVQCACGKNIISDRPFE